MFAQSQVLATTSNSGTTSHQAGSCFTLSRHGKRKRTELVLGADSSGIEVFDASTPNSRPITSYGIPPGDVFHCAPISAVLKTEKSSSHLRRTYWATSSGSRPSTSQARLRQIKLTCLQEDGTDVETPTTVLGSTEHPLSRIRSLDVIPSHDDSNRSDDRIDSSQYLLAIHWDGVMTCLSSNLQKTVFQGPLPGILPSIDTIEYSTTIALSEARESIVSAREDVLANVPNDEAEILACIVRQGSNGLRVVYFYLNPQPIHLFSLKVPGTEGTFSNSTQLSLHAKTARLYELRQGRSDPNLYIYDLKGYSARVNGSLPIPGASSFVRVSQHTVAVGLAGAIGVYDAKWRYLQGTIQAAPSDEQSSAVQVLDYFGTTGTVIGVHGTSLQSYNLQDETSSGDRRQKRRRTGGLADAVSQGVRLDHLPTRKFDSNITSSCLGKKLIPSFSRTAGAEIKKRFDPLQTESDPEAFDEAMLHALQTVTGSKKGPSIGYAAQPDLIAYAACALFDIEADSAPHAPRLVVRKMAPETFRFLLTHGLLTISQIEQSLRADGKLDRQQKLPASAMVHALTFHDETLQALIYYLSSAPLLSAQELSAGLLVCLRSVQRLASKQSTKAIENGPLSSGKGTDDYNGDAVMTNGIGVSEETADGFDDDWPDPDPEEGLSHNARSALGSCLTRLSLCNGKDIRQALRAAMSTTDILTLVDYIRMELSSGGWLARYLDEDLEGEGDLSAQTNQVNVAAKILNCAIDSLGATTWLIGSGSELEASKSADKVAYMQAEINAALEGIENSAFLQNMLHEVLLFARSAEEASQVNVNADIVPVPVGAESKEAQMLPLGLKKDTVSRTKISAGGKEIPRSARDISRLESRKVPEYSFERIMI